MARPDRNKKVNKTDFDLDSFLESEGLDDGVTFKEDSWLVLSEAFHDAVKLPGFPRGYVSMIRGFSNTGKSTAFYEGIKAAQDIGDLPVVIETEGNWQDSHAKSLGVRYKERLDKSTGELIEVPDLILIKGSDLLYRYENYCYNEAKTKSKPTRNEPVIEDVSHLINEFLEMQQEGRINKDIAFFWDSIGTLNCYKSAVSKTSNNMWNAGAMNVFQSIVNVKIPSTREERSPYTNSLICVQKIWLDNMQMGQPIIKHKCGEFMFYNSRLIFHLGGAVSHGTKKLKATALGQDFQYGIETKIKTEKNQITGLAKEGKIVSTSFGFISPDDLNDFKKDRRDYIHEMLKSSSSDLVTISDDDISFTEEEINGLSSEDMKS